MSEVKASIGEYIAPPKENPFRELIAALIEAGENNAATVTVEAAEVGKTRTKLGEAARDAGKTALLRDKTEHDDGTVSLVYQLVPKQNRVGAGRRPKNDDADGDKATPPAKGKAGK